MATEGETALFLSFAALVSELADLGYIDREAIGRRLDAAGGCDATTRQIIDHIAGTIRPRSPLALVSSDDAA